MSVHVGSTPCLGSPQAGKEQVFQDATGTLPSSVKLVPILRRVRARRYEKPDAQKLGEFATRDAVCLGMRREGGYQRECRREQFDVGCREVGQQEFGERLVGIRRIALCLEEGGVPCPFGAAFAKLIVLESEMAKAPTKHGSDIPRRTRVMKFVFKRRCGWRERGDSTVRGQGMNEEGNELALDGGRCGEPMGVHDSERL